MHPTFSLTQLWSPGGSCCLSPSQQPEIKELNLGRKQIKPCFPFPPAPTQLKTKAPFSESAQTSSALVLLCLRDQGWQGTVFIRQLYLSLCRREMVQTSSCYGPPQLPSLRREGRFNLLPGNWNLSTVYTSPLPPSLPLPREEQGILIISVVQM